MGLCVASGEVFQPEHIVNMFQLEHIVCIPIAVRKCTYNAAMANNLRELGAGKFGSF
jgi:hypothetical protein